MVQWLGLHASTARGMGSIPGQGTKIPHAAHHGQKKQKQKQKNLNQAIPSFHSYNSMHEEMREENSYDHLNQYNKSILQKVFMINNYSNF